MENLLRLEADAKHFFGATDRAYEQSLFDELLKIIEEAELLFGPRDSSYELLPPRITECAFGYPYIFPDKRIRIYLNSCAKTRSSASWLLAHETVHVLGPTRSQTTVLEEGLGDYFAQAYVNRVYGRLLPSGDRWYAAAKDAVAPLMAKNEFVIRELRDRQPQISKIDEKLLVEVAGIEPDHARYLCSDFAGGWRTASNLSEFAAGGTQIFVNGFRSILDRWKSG
jgi:hypothetical protein